MKAKIIKLKLEKRVMNIGTSGHVLLPKALIGEIVFIRFRYRDKKK